MTFSVPDFLPYLLNQAAEAASRDFQTHYRTRYGMLRTEWRVLFHLGCYGDMTATAICEKGSLHKTKVSRAVSALEEKRYLVRREDKADRRVEHLSLTPAGAAVFRDLSAAAENYEQQLVEGLSWDETATLRDVLKRLATRPTP